MFEYWFKNFDGLGNYDGCATLGDQANYVIFNVNTTGIPVALRFGMCMPSQCRQEQYDRLGVIMQSLVSDLMHASLYKIQIPEMLVPFLDNNSSVGMYFRNLDDYVPTWKSSLTWGYTAFGSLFIVLLLMTAAGTFYHIYKRPEFRIEEEPQAFNPYKQDFCADDEHSNECPPEDPKLDAGRDSELEKTKKTFPEVSLAFHSNVEQRQDEDSMNQ